MVWSRFSVTGALVRRISLCAPLHGFSSRQLSCFLRNKTFHSKLTQRRFFSNTCDEVQINRSGVEVLVEGQLKHLNKIWLRDNCRCSECYNCDTLQKNVLAKDISPDIDVKQGTLTNEKLRIIWNDGHTTELGLDWIKNNYYPGSLPKVKKYLWDKKAIDEVSNKWVPYEAFMAEDVGVKELLKNILVYGFGVVDGGKATLEATQEVVERVCHVQQTLFGGMWSFTADLARSDTAYTNIPLGCHTDTSYYELPMGIQCFHVMFHDGNGGETLLVDGFHAAESLRQSEPESFDILEKYRINHEYKENGVMKHHVISLSPILKTHPNSGELEWIIYNHYDRAPINTVPVPELPAYYHALRSLSDRMEAKEREHWIKLKPGQVLFVDNWRVLHGRAGFTGTRRVCGAYLPREDWLGRARTLGLV